MSTLETLLARAEAHVISRAAEVAAIAKRREDVKAQEKAAIQRHRQAQGLLVRVRGVIEAAVILPDAEEPEAADPVFVAIPEASEPERALPFTPALDYPDSHPVEIPARMVEEPLLPVAQALPEEVRPEPSLQARPAKRNGGGIRKLADAVLAILEAARSGSTASVEMADLYQQTGKSASAIKNAIEDLRVRKLIKPCRSAERGHLTVILYTEARSAA